MRRLVRRVSISALVLNAVASGNLRAQQDSQAPQLKVKTQEPQLKIAVETKTVSVLATVRDKHGKIIPNLTKDDFQIDEDLRNLYSLAYTPDKGNTIGYHKIHLTVPNQKDLVVTARDGYYYGQ